MLPGRAFVPAWLVFDLVGGDGDGHRGGGGGLVVGIAGVDGGYFVGAYREIGRAQSCGGRDLAGTGIGGAGYGNRRAERRSAGEEGDCAERLVAEALGGDGGRQGN